MLWLCQPAHSQDGGGEDTAPDVIRTTNFSGSTKHMTKRWSAETELGEGLIALHAKRRRAIAPDDGPGLVHGDRHSTIRLDAAYRYDLTAQDTLGLALTGSIDRRRFPGRTIDPRALMSGGYEAALQWRRNDEVAISAGWFEHDVLRHRAAPDRVAERANGAPLAGRGFHLGMEAPMVSGGDAKLTLDLRMQRLSPDDAALIGAGSASTDRRIAIGLRTHF